MFFRKKPRKKIFLTNIHYDCFDLLNYWLDAVTLHALVNQTLAAYDTDVSQASVADSRGETLGSGKILLGVASYFFIAFLTHIIFVVSKNKVVVISL